MKKTNTNSIKKAKNFANGLSNVAKMGTLYMYVKLCVLTYLKTKKDATPEELAKLLVSNTKVGISQIGIAVIAKIVAKILEAKLDDELEDEAEDIDNHTDELQDEIHEDSEFFDQIEEELDEAEAKAESNEEDDSKTDKD